ncbi:ABC transporter ATP-binding protein [uncultured Amnibacterium sp.]|uniref:ABC transporter ATP-binding protein n=1 Tax=uncultured Amnibacterium sp. TaxID=1631851 RepID=UPI0035C9F489
MSTPGHASAEQATTGQSTTGQGAVTGDPLLEVKDVTKYFPGRGQGLLGRRGNPIKAVDGVSFTLHAGETLGLVGESGCGKSTTGRVASKLIEPTGGSIKFHGREIASLSGRAMRPLRRDVQMIFQDPYSSLNPRHTIGTIVGSPYRIQGRKPDGGIKKTVQGLMQRVGLNPEHYNRYPHEFSGGQRQRIGIARALALQPQLIVCDEPVSALDVSVQAQVVNLLEDLQQEFGIAYVFIAHDLSVVRHIADRVAVMYLGKIMEITDRDALYEKPMHPYTHALLSAVPIPDPRIEARRERILLTGDLPSPSNPPSGCVFHTRCPKYRTQLDDSQREHCRTEQPVLEEKRPGHAVYCHYAEVREDLIEGEAAPAAAPSIVSTVQAAFRSVGHAKPAGD